jgi:hypothetical protein
MAQSGLLLVTTHGAPDILQVFSFPLTVNLSLDLVEASLVVEEGRGGATSLMDKLLADAY